MYRNVIKSHDSLLGHVHLFESTNSIYAAIDLYYTAAMLNLRQGEKEASFLHGKPRTELASGRGLPCENKDFYSPKPQYGRRVIRVYCRENLSLSLYCALSGVTQNFVIAEKLFRKPEI